MTEEKKSGKKATGTLIKIIMGAALVILGIWAIIGWAEYLWIVFRGCIGLILLAAGGITFAIAKE